MKKPRFTIITVCYNAEKYIEETIASLLKQKFTDYEYIIKDGKSSDSTMKIVGNMLVQNDKVCIVSKRDNGIFDAMNEAVSLAKGEYLFFLNAGDCLYNDRVLQNVDLYLKQNPAVEIAYGNVVLLGNNNRRLRKYSRICSKSIYAISGDCICHQSMFTKRELFQDKQFDLSYKVCSVRDWQFYFIKGKRNFGSMDLIVSIFREEGFCTSHMKEYEEETLQCVQENFNKCIIIGYKIIARMKKNNSFRMVLRLCGELLFHKAISI
jgi:glycosyltransferase involved in cell wall biosynthesis